MWIEGWQWHKKRNVALDQGLFGFGAKFGINLKHSCVSILKSIVNIVLMEHRKRLLCNGMMVDPRRVRVVTDKKIKVTNTKQARVNKIVNWGKW